jgi:tetratricopeptide (TPR) repeat protein
MNFGLLLALAVGSASLGPAADEARSAAPPGQPGAAADSPLQADKVDAAVIEQLIRQLGSVDFPEREAATRRLEEIGAPALQALRKAAKENADAEVRRRAEQLAEKVDPDSLETLFRAAQRQEEKKEYKKAAELFEKALKKGMEKYHPDPQNAPAGDLPILTELYLHSARVYCGLEEYEKAAAAYDRAEYYSNYNNEKRRQIGGEWSALTDKLLAGWGEAVQARIDKDPTLKALAAKHPLVLLHSRRYARGGYLRSAYSFLYATTDEARHYNDVQLLFDNGRRDNTFSIRMLVGQTNQVADLGAADFTRDPDPEKVGADGKTRWRDEECKAVDGHVYLEKVEDDRGNRFFVLFQVVSVDEKSRYVAFLWRQLPGGKVVRRH